MIILRKLVDRRTSKTEPGEPNLAERVSVQDLQPELDLVLLQIRELQRRITQQQARVTSLKALGASGDLPQDLLRILQRSHESLRRFLLRVVEAGKT
jgi:hypothetical protein